MKPEKDWRCRLSEVSCERLRTVLHPMRRSPRYTAIAPTLPTSRGRRLGQSCRSRGACAGSPRARGARARSSGFRAWDVHRQNRPAARGPLRSGRPVRTGHAWSRRSCAGRPGAPPAFRPVRPSPISVDFRVIELVLPDFVRGLEPCGLRLRCGRGNLARPGAIVPQHIPFAFHLLGACVELRLLVRERAPFADEITAQLLQGGAGSTQSCLLLREALRALGRNMRVTVAQHIVPFVGHVEIAPPLVRRSVEFRSSARARRSRSASRFRQSFGGSGWPSRAASRGLRHCAHHDAARSWRSALPRAPVPVRRMRRWGLEGFRVI